MIRFTGRTYTTCLCPTLSTPSRLCCILLLLVTLAVSRGYGQAHQSSSWEISHSVHIDDTVTHIIYPISSRGQVHDSDLVRHGVLSEAEYVGRHEVHYRIIVTSGFDSRGGLVLKSGRSIDSIRVPVQSRYPYYFIEYTDDSRITVQPLFYNDSFNTVYYYKPINRFWYFYFSVLIFFSSFPAAASRSAQLLQLTRLWPTFFAFDLSACHFIPCIPFSGVAASWCLPSPRLAAQLHMLLSSGWALAIASRTLA